MAKREIHLEVPYGYCHCGCGERAPLIRKTLRSRGYVKGEPHDYIHNHHLRSLPFDTYVEKCPSGCWEWQGTRGREGHGMYSVAGKNIMAHRYAWQRVHGPIPEGLIIRHLVCDNPPCVNPDHLAIGTMADNTEDAIRKRRHHLAKPPEVRAAIYEGWLAGKSYEQLVVEFEMSYGAISNLIRKRRAKDA